MATKNEIIRKRGNVIERAKAEWKKMNRAKTEK